MRLVGINPVVVHGGGPQITDLMQRLGKEPTFVDGRRVTDAETVDIVRMALVGKVNREVVASINQQGPYAVGLSGEDAGLITVTQRDPALGFVGDVSRIEPAILERLIGQELIPVIATVGVDETGQAYNVNADTVAPHRPCGPSVVTTVTLCATVRMARMNSLRSITHGLLPDKSAA